MKPLTEADIRGAFLNCSKGEAKRLNIPRDLAERPWGGLDFLGWRDPQAPDRAYLVTETGKGPAAVALRRPGSSGPARRSMCSLCLTMHSGGVSLMVAARSGTAGRQGNTVGAYMCDDLACPLYVRGKRDAGTRLQETLTVEERIARMTANLTAFLARITADK